MANDDGWPDDALDIDLSSYGGDDSEPEPEFSCSSAEHAVQQLRLRSPTLEHIDLTSNDADDGQLSELVECLLARPHVVRDLWLGNNHLTDVTGTKIARLVATSDSLEMLSLGGNGLLGEATYLAVAAALCVNASLRELDLDQDDPDSDRDEPVPRNERVEAAFVHALRVNPERPLDSCWRLYSNECDFARLKQAAERLGHPTMQALLVVERRQRPRPERKRSDDRW